jgi:hypothetical protein
MALVTSAVSWRDAPGHAALFVPANQRDAYSVAVTPASLEDVLADLGADETLVRAPGAWQPRQESAPDAFGTAGPYNRWLLARLYGSRLVRVVRGARADRGRVVEAWTLISPYPSADLRTLHPGTMRFILTVAP